MTTDTFEQPHARAQARKGRSLRFYERWWILGNTMTDGLLQHLWWAIDRFAKHGPRESAALSYYAIFSVFPLLLLLIIVIGTTLGPAAAHNQIHGVLRVFLPTSTASFLQDSIAETLQRRGSFGLVAGITLLWSSLGFFSNLSSALSRTFRDARGYNTWSSRLVGLGLMMALGVLVAASLATTVVFNLIDLLVFSQTTSWITTGALIVPLSLSVGIFAFLYRFIPRRRVRWDAIWVAAFLGGGAWEVAKRVFAWYLDNMASYSLVYGSVATMIVLLLWVYLTGIIILLGGELCVALDDWMSKRSVHDVEIAYTVRLSEAE